MAGITARSTREKLEDSLKAKDLRATEYVTAQPATSNRVALDTIPIGYFLKSEGVAIEAGSNDYTIVKTSHGWKRGDVIRFDTVANNIEELFATVHKVIDADTVELATILSDTLEAGDLVDVYSPRLMRVSDTGATIASVSGEPVSYTLNGGTQAVIKDTVTPSNNRPLPVELVGFTSGSISITSDELNVQLGHTGATYDSVRIGNGTNLLDIDGSGQAKVADAAVATALASLLTELQAKADLAETQPVSAASLPLPSGASTSANQSTIITALSNLLTELQAKADLAETQPVSAASLPLPSGASTSANQSTIITALSSLLTELQLKADLSETQPVSAASLPLPSGASTSANQSTINTTISTMSAKLPSSLGTKTAANSLSVTMASDQNIGITRLTVVDQMDTPLVDTSSSNIPASSAGYLTVVSSLAANVKAIKVIDDLGEIVGMYDGSGTLLCILPQGYTGGYMEISIASGTLIKLRNMKNATISTGHIGINFLG